jgi:hypothetical protein
VVLVALGSAVGSVVFLTAQRRRWCWRRILAVNAGICAVAGALAGILIFGASNSVIWSFIGYGVLGTAAPFTSTLVPLSPPHRTSDAWRLISRTGALLAVNALFCATSAMAAYMIVVGGLLYVRTA